MGLFQSKGALATDCTTSSSITCPANVISLLKEMSLPRGIFLHSYGSGACLHDDGGHVCLMTSSSHAHWGT